MPYRVAGARARRRTFIREWRKFRKLSLERLAEIIEMSSANLSRIESGKQDYTQAVLETVAEALKTDAAALLTRRPGEGDDELWPIWENATPDQKSQIAEIAKTITKGRVRH